MDQILLLIFLAQIFCQQIFPKYFLSNVTLQCCAYNPFLHITNSSRTPKMPQCPWIDTNGWDFRATTTLDFQGPSIFVTVWKLLIWATLRISLCLFSKMTLEAKGVLFTLFWELKCLKYICKCVFSVIWFMEEFLVTKRVNKPILKIARRYFFFI